MDHITLEDGDLLAYLADKDLPHVATALQQSPELRQELDELRRAGRLFTRLFDGLDRPAPQDMVDVLTGQASAAQQLRVAAYVRQSAAGQAAYEELQRELQTLTGTQQRSGRLPLFSATLAGAVAGLRATPAADDRDQSFVVAELQVRLTLRLVPRPGDTWAIEGYLTRRQQPAAGVVVRLTAEGAHPRPRTTDADGFFTFPRLRAGTYQLRATFDEGVVVIRGLVLSDD